MEESVPGCLEDKFTLQWPSNIGASSKCLLHSVACMARNSLEEKRCQKRLIIEHAILLLNRFVEINPNLGSFEFKNRK